MKKYKSLLLILFGLLPTIAVAGTMEPKPQPFKLNTYDEQKGEQKNLLEYSSVSNLALKCMYDKEWLDIDVDIQSGVSTRDKGFNQYQDTFAGLVVRVPLYSGKELDRERSRTVDRKKDIVNDAKSLIESVEKVLHGRRMLSMYAVLEKRGQKRVMQGVAPLEEQVEILEKISAYKKQLITDEADALGSAKMLVARCKDGSDKKNLKNYLDRLGEMEIE